MYCPQCGTELENNAKECACGWKVVEDNDVILDKNVNSSVNGINEQKESFNDQPRNIDMAPANKVVVMQPYGAGTKVWSGLSITVSAVVLLFVSIPLLYDMILSVKSFNYMKGIVGSPFVGFDNFRFIFAGQFFMQVLRNSIMQNLLFSIFMLIVACLIGYAVSLMPSGTICRNTLVTLLLIPAFVPDVVYAGWLMKLYIGAFSKPEIAVWFFPLARAVKYCGLAVLTISVLSEIKQVRTFKLPLEVGGMFALFSLMFISVNDMLFNFLVYNPKTYSVLDTFDTYAFRQGLMMGAISEASSITIVRVFLVLLSAAILFFPLAILAEKVFNIPEQSPNMKYKVDYANSLISSIIAIAIAVGIYVGTYHAAGTKVFDIDALSLLFQNPEVIHSMVIYIPLCIAAAIISTVMSAVIAYPAVCGSNGIKTGSLIILLLITALGSLPMSIGSYALAKSMGMVNTIYIVFFCYAFNFAGTWALIATAKAKNVRHGGYVRVALLPCMGLFLAQAAYNFNNYLLPMTFVSNKNMFSPSLVLRGLMFGAGSVDAVQTQQIIFWYGLLVAAVPVAGLILLRLFLNGRNLLSIISLGIRR